MVCTKSLKVFYAECNPKMCDILALCDRLMFGNNLYVFLFVGRNLSSEENVF